MQAAQLPIPPVPAKPGCLVWFAGDPCDQLIQQYNQAIAQRQQQEWQVQATAPLEKQVAGQQKLIADQKNQIQALQLKLDSQTSEALQSQARSQAFVDGIGAVIGAGLAFLVTVIGFRRLTRGSLLRRDEDTVTSTHCSVP
jgi:hypothetical protein